MAAMLPGEVATSVDALESGALGLPRSDLATTHGAIGFGDAEAGRVSSAGSTPERFGCGRR